MPNNQQPPMSAREVSIALGTDIRTVHRRASRGEIPAEKLPGPKGAFIFDREQIEQLASERAS